MAIDLFLAASVMYVGRVSLDNDVRPLNELLLFKMCISVHF